MTAIKKYNLIPYVDTLNKNNGYQIIYNSKYSNINFQERGWGILNRTLDLTTEKYKETLPGPNLIGWSSRAASKLLAQTGSSFISNNIQFMPNSTYSKVIDNAQLIKYSRIASNIELSQNAIVENSRITNNATELSKQRARTVDCIITDNTYILNTRITITYPAAEPPLRISGFSMLQGTSLYIDSKFFQKVLFHNVVIDCDKNFDYSLNFNFHQPVSCSGLNVVLNKTTINTYRDVFIKYNIKSEVDIIKHNNGVTIQDRADKINHVVLHNGMTDEYYRIPFNTFVNKFN
jgi:hypothetical protein